MATFGDLEALTATFFDRHWPSAPQFGAAPRWIPWKPFLVGSVPNYQLGGCYALIIKERLCYVGLGVSKGAGRYLDMGISRRLMSHVLKSSKKQGSTDWIIRDKWVGVTAIYTIGFDGHIAYLAPALESFLIRSIDDLSNVKV